eukprot:14452.XXX_442040_441841_1 [CDS] Oithona nana genome sequencing.
MKTITLWSMLGLALLSFQLIHANEDQADGEDPEIHSARIESCAG